MEMMYNKLPVGLRKSREYSFTLNIPQVLKFKENTMVQTTNYQFNFNETYYYLKGRWKVTLKLHNGQPYYSKERLIS